MEKTSEQMIRELYTVILGVPNTQDKGMAKQVADIEKHLRELNEQVTSNTTWRKALCWSLGVLATFCGIFAGMYFGG